MKGKPKPHTGDVYFKTKITNIDERLEEVFMADAEFIIEHIMLRTRASTETHERLALFLKRVANWDDKRPSMQDRFLYPRPKVGKSSRRSKRVSK